MEKRDVNDIYGMYGRGWDGEGEYGDGDKVYVSHSNPEYDAVSDLMHNLGPQRPDFKSALRVVKMVLNTQCYQYLWLTM